MVPNILRAHTIIGLFIYSADLGFSVLITGCLYILVRAQKGVRSQTYVEFEFFLQKKEIFICGSHNFQGMRILQRLIRTI